jgi:DNA repair protein RadB
MEKVASGSEVIDDLLEGGYETSVITTIYGPAGSGKSNLVLLAVATVQGKALFIDTEGSFSVERLTQLAPNAKEVLDRVSVLKATSLQQQTSIIARLPEMMKGIKLVVVDGIAGQYRAAIARGASDVNSELSQQMNTLYAIAADNNIPVIITSQVYADLEGDGVKVVGGDIVKYSSKCLLELRNEDGKRTAIIARHRSLPSGRSREFVIDNIGIYAKTQEKE